MELRRANEEIACLKSACIKVGKESDNLKKILKSKDAHVEKITQENLKIRHDSNGMVVELKRQERNIMEMDARVQEHNASYQVMADNLSAIRCENDGLKANLDGYDKLRSDLVERTEECQTLRDELLDSARNCEILKNDLLDSDKELEILKIESGRENAKLTRDNQRLENVVVEIKYLYNDSILAGSDGTSYLLGSGKMLSLDSICKLWMRDNGFNGEPTYHLRCVQSDTTTTVVRSPAVSKFVKEIAGIVSLNITPNFYFRFSEKPTTEQPIRWTIYNPFDQLTLVAKLIYMYKSRSETSSFQAMVMENHVVTATCVKDRASYTTRVKIALNVITKTGVANPHHIEFVDSMAMEDDNESLFPSDFVVGA
jgi:hypothetical protein